MIYEPVHKRQWHAFLSHSSVDKKAFVHGLNSWFTKIANIPVLYDQDFLSGGSNVPDALAEAIPRCRAMVLVLSEASVKSPWVNMECTLAIEHKSQYKDFKIIPVLIEDCEIPPSIRNLLRIDARNNYLTGSFFKELFQALYPFDPSVQFRNTTDIFVSRTWRNSEADFADRVCQRFIQSGFRLIGDSQDHPSYRDNTARVKNIVSSCGGLLSILPYREDKSDSYHTSPYCLDEIKMAHQQNLPSVVIAEPGVTLPTDFKGNFSVTYLDQAEEKTTIDEAILLKAVEIMNERWKKIENEHYVFFATNFDNPELTQMVRQLIQQITGMPCVLGEDVHVSGTSVQSEIANLIRCASLTVADVSKGNINTFIEAGIARGANVEYRMVAHETAEFPRKKPPFMFRDRQVEYYADGAELLGRIRRLTYPFRRRILNYEIEI